MTTTLCGTVFGCVTSWNGRRVVSRLIGIYLFWLRFVSEFYNKLVLTCLGVFVVSVRMCDLVLLVFSCLFYPLIEIWICLVFVLFKLCFIPCLRSMLFVLSSWVPLFVFVSYYFVMILLSSSDRGPSKAFAQVYPGLVRWPSDPVQRGMVGRPGERCFVFPYCTYLHIVYAHLWVYVFPTEWSYVCLVT